MAKLVDQIKLLPELIEMIKCNVNVEIENGLDCLYRVLKCITKAEKIEEA